MPNNLTHCSRKLHFESHIPCIMSQYSVVRILELGEHWWGSSVYLVVCCVQQYPIIHFNCYQLSLYAIFFVFSFMLAPGSLSCMVYMWLWVCLSVLSRWQTHSRLAGAHVVTGKLKSLCSKKDWQLTVAIPRLSHMMVFWRFLTLHLVHYAAEYVHVDSYLGAMWAVRCTTTRLL